MLQDTNRATDRSVARVVEGIGTSDGAGVALTRIIGQPALPDLDPFLLLDEFRSDDASDYIAGFPEHPHRGFETVTYMLAGRMRHGDNKGNSGLLTAHSVQWMTAGSGIVHSEMPEQEEGLMWGFQLWVNLPAKNKMTAPRYQDIAPERIPEVERYGARVRVIAGRFDGVAGPVATADTEPTYLDVELTSPDATFETALPATHNAFVYAYDGSVAIGSTQPRVIARGELAVLSPGERVVARTQGEKAAFILAAGRPLGEPIARYGPIVMNTQAELRSAFEDLRTGRF
ncbi:MAG: pirin family protein [Candidatus Tumulicola sp.]